MMIMIGEGEEEELMRGWLLERGEWCRLQKKGDNGWINEDVDFRGG